MTLLSRSSLPESHALASHDREDAPDSEPPPSAENSPENSPDNSKGSSADASSAHDASTGSDSTDSFAPPLVHFAGTWSAPDLTAVARTVQHVESLLSPPGPSRALGEPWVCTCQPVHDGHHYTAHRFGYTTTIAGRSARELILRLHTWAANLSN